MKNIFYVLLGSILLLVPSFLGAQTDMAQKVATDLFFASGKISEARPNIKVVTRQSLPATIENSNNQVTIDQKALDICGQKPNALATLLAPLFASGEGDSMVANGAFIGYMAGYKTLGPDADALWTSLYAAFPKMEASTGRDAREESMIKAEAELKDYIPVFEMANYFTIVGKYEYASTYYDKIKLRFPSREVYNNAGIINALLALDCYSREDLTYTYPFVLDLSSQASQKGEMHKKEIYLKAAKEDFSEALRRDPDYAIGYVNLSCTQSLLKDFSEAIANAKKAKTLAERQGSDRLKGSALIALGIAYAESGDKTKSDEAFSLASKIDDESVQKLVKINLKQDVVAGEEKTFWDDEEISGSTTAGLAANIIHESGLKEPFQTIPIGENTSLFVVNETGYQLFYQKEAILKEGNLPTTHHWFFQKTSPTYDGKSAGEIARHADISELLEAYGEPTVVRRYGDGRFYYYKSTGVIFKVNEDNSVEGWTLVHEN